MATFSNKELYMMNGGKKHYIRRDGFGDVYTATVSEEDEWTKEIIANAVARIETEDNATVVKFAIENLSFHQYAGLEALLVAKVMEEGPVRQVIFATALWSLYKYPDSFEIIYRNLQQHRHQCLNTVFLSLDEFKNNDAARQFIITCLTGDEAILHTKAHMAISMWAYTGMPLLRENNLLEQLKIENKNQPSFKVAVGLLEEVFRTSKLTK
jgi:hypothetical protein